MERERGGVVDGSHGWDLYLHNYLLSTLMVNYGPGRATESDRQEIACLNEVQKRVLDDDKQVILHKKSVSRVNQRA